PQCPVIAENPPNLSEHLDHLFDVFFRRRFEADLSRYAVIAKAPIRGRGNTSMNDSIRQRPKGFDHVALYNLIHRIPLYYCDIRSERKINANDRLSSLQAVYFRYRLNMSVFQRRKHRVRVNGLPRFYSRSETPLDGGIGIFARHVRHIPILFLMRGFKAR